MENFEENASLSPGQEEILKNQREESSATWGSLPQDNQQDNNQNTSDLKSDSGRLPDIGRIEPNIKVEYDSKNNQDWGEYGGTNDFDNPPIKRHKGGNSNNQAGNTTGGFSRADENNVGGSRKFSRSRSRSKEKEYTDIPKYTYVRASCCSKCRSSDNNGKTCVCVVPASKRKVLIDQTGCKRCGCSGCTREDFEKKLPPKIEANSSSNSQYHQSHDHHSAGRKYSSDSDSLMKNGCCKKCMKAFSRNGKACLCQVPNSVRKSQLPEEGCNFCGCQGCNPEDTRRSGKVYKKHSEKKGKGRRFSYSDSDSDNDRFYDSRSQSSYSSRSSKYEEPEQNLNNFDKSSIGGFIINNLNLFPPLIGFGIPQRTYSYIMGKPMSSNYK